MVNFLDLFTPKNFRFKVDEEALTQITCVNFLKNLTLSHNLKGIWFSIPNEYAGSNKPVFGMKLQALGKIKGAPDLVILTTNKPFLFEFKSKKGRQSVSQKAFQEWCQLNDISYNVIRGFEDFLKVLKENSLC